MTDRDPAFEDWIEDARSASMVACAERLGARLRRLGSELVGPCPRCNGTDRFSIREAKGVWNCRGSEGGGDAISLVMHCQELDFIRACEWINDRPPPRGEGRAVDPDVMRERKEERRDARIERDERDAAEAQRKVSGLDRLWQLGRPLPGTMGEAYFVRRAIRFTHEQMDDLRFVPALDYTGYADPDAPDAGVLMQAPAILAAMRLPDGTMRAIHRTYLTPGEPTKLVPPGDRARNKAKKVVGIAGGALIYLGPPKPTLAVGEGIETTGAWYGLGFGPDDTSIAAAYSLGNIAGGSLGTLPHPVRRNEFIANGVPDPDKPGMRLPECVRSLILLGDGDSDVTSTRARLLTAARRHAARGLDVSVHMAPEGLDFADLALELAREAAA